MGRHPSLLIVSIATTTALLFGAEPADAARRRPPAHEAAGHQTFASPQANPIAIAETAIGPLLFVANTTSNSVEVIDAATNAFIMRVAVGLEPVSLAVRPDQSEVWVSNHVSDSVSVIDATPGSSTFLRVVETIQDLDANGVSRFDEPVGIAFADDTKAYVALSSRNRIAIVNATTYAVTGSIKITAHEPRAIAVRNGRLYVAAFESGNQSELSACFAESDTDPQCTLSINDLITFATNPNIPGEDKNIVIDPQVPDRDLFVFNTSNDTQAKNPVQGVGTLLYGLAVDGSNRVYVAQTEARNAVNGITAPAGSRQDVNGDGDVNLADLGNRMFTNEIAVVDCGAGGPNCSFSRSTDVVDLDPSFPDSATALATPHGIALTSDGSLVVATASGTNRVFSMNASGTILDRLSVGAIPRGVVLRDNGDGTHTAYVLNTLGNSVSVVTVDDATGALSGGPTLAVGTDPTPEAVRLGAIAFNNAFASTSGTFSCGSCHPDANTDQLLWRIGGECFFGACVAGEDEPRSTMPIRGLRDTLPLHWDGTLGDPFGGPDGSTGGGNSGTNCSGADPHSCFRQLVDASMSGVMCDQSNCPNGDSGLPGLFTTQEREDMATFLERVSYPPARSRRIDDSVSRIGDGVVITDPDGNSPMQVGALEGFEDFFMDQNGGGNPDTCADSNAGCHELPLGTATNSAVLQAFDAPTMRGMTDRYLQFSLGVTGAEELLAFANAGFPAFGISPLEAPIQWDPAEGHREITTFGAAFAVFEPTYGVRPLDMFQMFEEASAGHSGATGRQVMLNTRTAGACTVSCGGATCRSCTFSSCEVGELLKSLEAADERGVVNLRGSGLRNGGPIILSYQQNSDLYRVGGVNLNCETLINEAKTGALIATLTAHLRSSVSEESPQPLIAPVGAQCDTGPNTPDPLLPDGSSAFVIEGAHVATGDAVFLNGQATGLTVSVTGTSTACSATEGHITTQLLSVPSLSRTGSTDLLQIRSANGLLSNELPLP